MLTGSAVGSNLARLFNLSRKDTIILLACGSSAAMAAIFKAPIASIVFAIEVLMLDLTATAIVPLLISYLHHLMHSAKYNNPLRHIWVVLPAALFSGGFLLFLIGFEMADNDQVHKMFHLVTDDIYNVVLAGELIYLLLFVIMTLRQSRLIPGSIFSFLFRGKKIGLSRLQLGVGMISMVVNDFHTGGTSDTDHSTLPQ